MKWIEILRKDNYALLQSESDTQYAVVCSYDSTKPEDQQWANGTYFTYWGDTKRKADCLQSALNCFRSRTEENYIPRCRLEELAALFKDGLISNDKESAMEYFNEVCEMTNEEKNFFHVETNKIGVEFTIRTSYSTEKRFGYFNPEESIEAQIIEIMRDICFCDSYRITEFHEVDSDYIEKRKNLIKNYELLHGAESLERDLGINEYTTFDELVEAVKGE